MGVVEFELAGFVAEGDVLADEEGLEVGSEEDGEFGVDLPCVSLDAEGGGGGGGRDGLEGLGLDHLLEGLVFEDVGYDFGGDVGLLECGLVLLLLLLLLSVLFFLDFDLRVVGGGEWVVGLPLLLEREELLEGVLGEVLEHVLGVGGGEEGEEVGDLLVVEGGSGGVLRINPVF